MKRELAPILCLIAVACMFAGPLFADDIAWSNIIGIEVGDLNATQKNRLRECLSVMSNTRGCSGTIAQCLGKGDLTARRHAGFVARMIQKGKDDKTIKKYVELRHESAYPTKIADIDLVDRPFSGDKNAKVVLVEYGCFECPLCLRLAPELKKLKEKFEEKLVIYFKYFPVRSHERGVPAAIAAQAAHRQGKFWSMHDSLYENQTDLEENDLMEYVKKSGLDIERWQQDLKDPSILRVVEDDKKEGLRNGVDGTPTFFVNGKRFKSVHEIKELEDRIAEEIDIVEGKIP